MNRIKGALTRKIGPFAAWVWFGIAAGALYFYRRHTASGGSGDQQQGGPALTYYGPYGQDAFPIQGGAGTGPGISSDTGSGTNNDGGNTNGGPPVINIAAPPTAPNSNGGKPRAQKPQPKHWKKVKGNKPSILGIKKSAKRSETTTHTNQARTKTTSKGGTKHSRGSRTLKHPGSPGQKAATPAPGAKHPQQPAHKKAPKSGPKPPPHTMPHTPTKPATRKVTRR